MFGVRQGSNLEPLLFHIFLADLFLIQYDIDIAMLADDNTPHISDKIIEDVIEYLEKLQCLCSDGLKTTF